MHRFIIQFICPLFRKKVAKDESRRTHDTIVVNRTKSIDLLAKENNDVNKDLLEFE